MGLPATARKYPVKVTTLFCRGIESLARGHRCGTVSSLSDKNPSYNRGKKFAAARSGVSCYQVVHGCFGSLIKLWLGFGTQSWSHSMGQVGILASMSHRRNHSDEAFFQYSGMFHVLIRMLLRTLEQLSSGSQNAALSMPMHWGKWLAPGD